MNQNKALSPIEKLKEEREQILQKLIQLEQIILAKVDADFEDAVVEFEAHENAAALILPLRDRLKTIDDALQQSQQGRYGICERCGQPIDPARLEILPEATFCTECKRIVEQRKEKI